MLKMARSPLLVRSLEGITSLPFAGPSALVFAQAELPASRDILVIAHRHHSGLIDAIERRQGARAESLAREHARLALANLEIVVDNRDALDRVPGAALITLVEEAEPDPAADPAAAPEPDPAADPAAAPEPA
jgi:GntR family transcriptional regulator of vanillate catabolism